MPDRTGARSAPATDRTVVAGDWEGVDLTGQVHERTLFQDAEFSECVGDGAQFVDCTFRSGRFDAAKLTAANFENCTFLRCSFFNTVLTDCKFIGSTFDECDFAQLQVNGGNWSFVGLPAADLKHARLKGVRMHEVDLTGAQCRGGALLNCDLASARWSRADLRTCDLRGCDLSSLDPFGVQLSGTIVDVHQAVTIAHNLGLDIRTE